MFFLWSLVAKVVQKVFTSHAIEGFLINVNVLGFFLLQNPGSGSKINFLTSIHSVLYCECLYHWRTDNDDDCEIVFFSFC